MTYKRKEISGEPTREMISEFIAKKKLKVSADYVLDFWRKKNWVTLKGHKVMTLESAVCACNGVYVANLREDNKKTLLYNRPVVISKMVEKSPYSEQLTDDRWSMFRDFVFKVRGNRCEMCGRKKTLQVHHLHYKKGAKAWEYDCNEVVVLCRECHRKVHGIK